MRNLKRYAAVALISVTAMTATTWSAEAAPRIRPSIVGGQPADIAQAPWQALMTIKGNEVCGASYLSSTWLLTAAHCVDEGVTPQAVQVFTGISRLSQRSPSSLVPVGQILVNPAWTPSTNDNDVALIRLDRPLTPSATVQPIRLPEGQSAGAWPAAGTPARLFGWGTQTEGGQPSEVLRRGDMQILAGPGSGACGAYGDAFHANTMICAGGPGSSVDACQGDSGGGLVVDVNGTPVLAGVTSTGNGCGVPEFPGVYARVTNYLPWIASNVGTFGMAPSSPGGVTATALGKGKVKVSWSAPALDGNSAITAYAASATPGGKRCATDGAGTTCTISGLRKGSRVVIAVAASNGLGQGPAAKSTVRVR